MQRFPHVLTTYRLTEHHTAGGMSRYVSHLAELQPEFFAEISPALAARDRASTRRLGHHRVAARRRRSARARHVAHAVAPASTAASIHQVGLPYHWGYEGLVTGDSANDLDRDVRGAERPHHGNQGPGLPHRARAPRRADRERTATYLDTLMRA